MNPNQIAAFKILEQAQQALKSGDKNTAHQLAEQASDLAPELEQVWLLMAALAAPRESVGYLEMALQINPNSERAKKGLAWAQDRIKREQPSETFSQVIAEPVRSFEQEQSRVVDQEPAEKVEQEPANQIEAEPVREAVVEPREAAVENLPAWENETIPPAAVAIPAPRPAVQGKKPTAKRPWLAYAVLLAVLICLVLVWTSWQNVTPATAFFANPFSAPAHGSGWSEVNIAKAQDAEPVLAGSATPDGSAALMATSAPVLVSATPTENLTPTDAATAAASVLMPTETVQAATDTAVSPTDTSLPPTETAVPPTDTVPAPTETAVPPTDTAPAPSSTPIPMNAVEQPSATPDLGVTEQASPTPLPTDTAIAAIPTLLANATAAGTNALPTPKAASLSGMTGHWFDVDLTHQMLYAYDGDTLVNSFLVSTGTWQYPTVTGKYHIYVKYRYTDMSGPGYYLPNVPFTMYFYQGYALHGTYWHHNFGTPMSHGCVNLSIPDSEWVFNFGSVGTLVNVHN